MNKRRMFLGIAILIILLISTAVVVIISKRTFLESSDISYTVKQAKAENQTIIKEFTSSMQVSSGLTEKIELHATYYYKELCVEKNTYIKEGENILKYTNGTYLTAPYDLVVTNYSLPEIDGLCKDSHYIEVQTTETLSASIDIYESDMEYIALGKEVEITINAFEETKYKGYITSISESATDSKFSGTVTFINDGNIKLGMSGSCTILLQEAKDVIVVPVEAIEIKDDTKYVVAVNDDGTTKDLTIETGIANSNYVEIKGGLEIGQTIQYIDVATGEVGNITSSTRNNQSSTTTREMMRALQ